MPACEGALGDRHQARLQVKGGPVRVIPMFRGHDDAQWSQQLVETRLRPIGSSLVPVAAGPLAVCLVLFQPERGIPLRPTVHAFVAPSIHSEVLNGAEVLVPLQMYIYDAVHAQERATKQSC